MISSGKFWIGIAISVVLLVLFLITVDIGRMAEALASANYLFLVPAIGLYLISVWFRTMRWKLLLQHMKPIRTARLYPVVTIGYMANNLLPMRLGELVRSYYVGEREGVSKASALVTIFIERIFDALILLFFVAVISFFVPLSGMLNAFGDMSGVAGPLLIVIFAGPFIVAFGTLILFALLPDPTKAFAMILIRPLPQRFEARLIALIDYFLLGLSPMRNPKNLALLFLLSAPIWLFEAGLFFLIGFSFDLQNSYSTLWQMAMTMILVTAIANIGSSIPAAPGGIGLFELVARETLVLLPLATIDRSVAAGFAAVTHAALLLPMIILGQVFLWANHISLRKLSQAGQTQEETLTGDSFAGTPGNQATPLKPSMGED